MSALAAGLILALGITPAGALTKLEGEYQLMLSMRKSLLDRPYPWDFDSNNGENYDNAELRLFSQPRPGVEAFIKHHTVWDQTDNGGRRPHLQYRESHLRFRHDMTTRGWDTYLFSRQNRFYFEKYLIEIAKSDLLKHGDKRGDAAQGARLETWGYGTLTGTFVASNDVSGIYIGRLRREFWGRRLRLGTTAARKVDFNNEMADVWAFDSRYNWRDIDFSLEYAQSTSPINTVPARTYQYPEALGRPLSVLRRPIGITLPDESVLTGEIRALRFGTPRAGYLNVAPLYWHRGPRFENRTGDANRDETGFQLNAWYLLPERAITLTSNYKRFSKSAYERRQEIEFYNEAYVEFVNGFTGKTYFRQRETRRYTLGANYRAEDHDDWFNELQVESRLAWMRLQSKIKDVGQRTRKQLYALETRVNLTDQVKSYNRFAFGNDPSRLRKGIFTQIQYYPSSNVVMFIEYGPNYIGDASTPVDDSDLEGGGDQSDVFKFILKGTF
jgi:hypothetical protein